MKFNFPLNNFTSGEWSPRMSGRTDVEQYTRACATLTNMLVQMSGGASYRGGTSIFPDLSPTMIADMDDYAPTGAASSSLHMYNPYDTSKRAIIMQYAVTPLSLYIRVYSVATGWVTPTSMTVVNFGNFADMNFVQLGDLLILADKTGVTAPVVFWHDGTVYRMEVYDFYADVYLGIPYYQSTPMDTPEALDSGVTINPSATTGAITLTVGAAPDGRDAVSLQNKWIRFAKGPVAAGYALTAFTATNATTITATVVKTLPASGIAYGATSQPDTFLQISMWDSTAGWPRTVTAHQGRLLFGGTRSNPDTVWGSQISNFFWFQEVPEPDTTGPYGFDGGAYAADNSRAFALTPNSKEASNIQALSASKTLTIHTDRSEIIAYGANGALGPNNVVFESSTSFGAERVQPERVNNFLTFVQNNGRKIRDIIFNFNEDQYKSTDLAFTVEHFFRDVNASTGNGNDSIVGLTRTEGDSSILWARTRLGKLFAVTLDRDYEINAWSRIVFGKSEDQTAPAKVLAFTHFRFEDDEDEVLVLMMSREIDGVQKIVLEYMNNPWSMENVYNIAALGPFGSGITARPHYLDFSQDAYPAGGSYPNDTWQLGTGGGTVFDQYYKNTTVSVIADGNYVGEWDIGSDANQEFVLDAPATEVQVGFLYEGRLVTMPIEQGGQTGVPMGRQKKIDELVIKFVNSLGCKFGHSEETLEEIDFREASQPMDEATDYFTGEKAQTFPAGYERDLQVIIVQDQPYPMHIAAVVPRGTTYD